MIYKKNSKYINDSQLSCHGTSDMLKQSKKEQRIRHIEKSLESFYIPVQDILEDPKYDFNPLKHLPIHPHYEYMVAKYKDCLLYTSPSPRDRQKSRMPS